MIEQRLPFLESYGKQVSWKSGKIPKVRPYVWGNVVAGFLVLCALLLIAFVIFPKPEIIILVGPFVLYQVVTAVGLGQKRRWSLYLFYTYSVFILFLVVPLIVVASLISSGGSVEASALLWIITILVFGPASIPYFVIRTSEFQ